MAAGRGRARRGVVGSTLLLRWSALATTDVDGWRWVVLLGGVWRPACMATVATVPYARGGRAALRRSPAVASWRRLAAHRVAAATTGAGWGGLAGVAIGAAAAAALIALAWRRLGGFTGDVLGAAGVVLETVALVVVAARW